MKVHDILQTDRIQDIQLHMYESQLLTFHNTFFREALKRVNKGIPIRIIKHDHLLHQTSQLPFAIVNSTIVIPKKKMVNLLEAILMEQPVKLGYFRPIFTLCEELADLSRIFAEKGGNPYYLLLSPFKKFQVFQFNNQFKKDFFVNSNYINQDHEKQSINQGYFAYQLKNLASYAYQFNKSHGIELEQQMIMKDKQSISNLAIVSILCVYSLLTSFEANNQYMHKKATEIQILKSIYEEGAKILTQPIPMQQNAAVYISILKPEEKEDKKVHQNPQLVFYEKLVIPIIGFSIFWKIYRIFRP